MTKLGAALNLARRGLRVHPLHWIKDSWCSCGKDCGRSAGKHPMLRGWIDKATTDQSVISDWWSKTPDANIGIACGEGSGIVALDVDGDVGRSSLAKLDLPRTFRVKTGGDGSHLYFKHAPGIRNTVQKIAPGLDVRTERGNLVGPGSVTVGEYTIEDDAPIAELPAALADLMRSDPTDEPSDVPPPDEHETPRDTRERRARAYARTIDPAISGSGGHTATFVAAEKIVRGFELDEPAAYRVLAAEWNPRCSPPWDAKDLRRKVREAKEKGRLAWGSILRAPRAATVVEADWRSLLLLDAKQRPSACLSNVITILRYHDQWRGVLAWDAFADRVVYRRPPPWRTAAAPATSSEIYTEHDAARIVDWFAHTERLHAPHRVVEQAIGVVAESDHMHPIREYLESLTWDGVDRLDGWLSAYAGAVRTEYTEQVGSKWMISAVARIMRPGCQVDCTLVLEGPQGAGKSKLFRSLVPRPEFYSETGVAIGEKDSYQSLHGVWIYVLDELDSLKRSEVTRIKSFLCAPKDHYRPSYGRVAKDYPRSNVFGGTTNEQEYLIDRSGNRRFWPVRVSVVRIDSLVADRDQLWAEAHYRYSRGDLWYADTPSLRRLCEAQQYDRCASDPAEAVVAAWLQDPRHRTTGDTLAATGSPVHLPAGRPRTVDICVHALGIPIDRIGRGDHMRAADILRQLGFERGRLESENGVRVRRYTLHGTALRDDTLRDDIHMVTFEGGAGGDPSGSEKAPVDSHRSPPDPHNPPDLCIHNGEINNAHKCGDAIRGGAGGSITEDETAFGALLNPQPTTEYDYDE
jgi:predicted P-loop ATPase